MLAAVVSCPHRETAQGSKPGGWTECAGSHPIPSKLGAAECGHTANKVGDLSQLNITSSHLVELVFTENKNYSPALPRILPLKLKIQGGTREEAPIYTDNFFGN